MADKANPKEKENEGLTRRALLGTAALGSAAIASTMIEGMWPDEVSAAPDDKLPGDFLFALDFGRGPTAFFKSISGLTSESEIVEFQEGSSTTTRKRPGRVKYGDITLKRGYVNSDDLWSWRRLVEENKMDEARKQGSILLLDSNSRVHAQYNFYEAWPSKWYVPDLDSDQSDAFVEAITIAVERVERSFKF